MDAALHVDSSLRGCCTASTGKQIPTFRRIVVLPSSWSSSQSFLGVLDSEEVASSLGVLDAEDESAIVVRNYIYQSTRRNIGEDL
jgi:hypothetical protein